ncbi:MAG TPA: hypothetical protein VFG43_02675 [Geminicoccaceae bacterium]|nr:hypothetical protein [Geminicoccaceae bacterium]
MALLAAAALAACTPAPTADTAAPLAAGQVTAEAAYPDLRDVPPRPRLSYTIRQRRQIADALVSDRENARYLRDVARYETGQSAAPPPAEPPPRVAEPEPVAGRFEPPPAAPPAPLPGGGAFAETHVAQQILSETNDGSLGDFLRILERQQAYIERAEAAGISAPPTGGTVAPGALAVEPESVVDPALAVPPEPADDPAAGAVELPAPAEGAVPGQAELLVPADDAAPRTAPAGERPLPALALDELPVEPAAPPAPRPPPEARGPLPVPPPPATVAALAGAGRLLLAVPFGPGAADPPPGLAADLEAAVAGAADGQGRLALVGRGASPAQGLDRARAVANLLLRLGVPGDRLALRSGGSGDEVLVYLLSVGAS